MANLEKLSNSSWFLEPVLLGMWEIHQKKEEYIAICRRVPCDKAVFHGTFGGDEC